MSIKAHLPEIILALSVGFMFFYPPVIGAVLFGLSLVSLASFRLIDRLHTRDDEKIQTQIDKLKTDVERLTLRGRG